MIDRQRDYNAPYSGEYLNRIAFPLGGLGAGMLCIEGTAALSHFSLRHKPEVFNEPCVFSAICIKGQPNIARILEGPVPPWKIFGNPGTGNGAVGTTYGLPRFASATFLARFPFATVNLTDDSLPIDATITAWSPFIPDDADNSSLPVATLEFHFNNKSNDPIDCVYSFNAKNFMSTKSGADSVRQSQNGFILSQTVTDDKPWDEGYFCATVSDDNAKINYAWFRGGWFDPLTVAWKDVEEGTCYERPPITDGDPSPGATIFVPFHLEPGKDKTFRLMFSWYVPETNLRWGKDPGKDYYSLQCGCSRAESDEWAKLPKHKPWYAAMFSSIDDLAEYWRANYDKLRDQSKAFSDSFYTKNLPPEVLEAVAANLTILKSPTILRQTDGRLWCWEGCCDSSGCCAGSCTHVWNYAQALPHLFPELERGLRETEFNESQDERGHQNFRTALPIREAVHDNHAAADGQLGGIMKVHREWRINGDIEWLRNLWSKVRASLDYCIETWDPDRTGLLVEPHHNTYDIEFWGPDGMCSSFYLGALKATVIMGNALGDDVSNYDSIFADGLNNFDSLFNGEYFQQNTQWKGLRAKSPLETKSLVGDEYSPEAIELFEKEGPKYQYGAGCLSDGILGEWMAVVCGVGGFLPRDKVRSHLKSVFKYNFKRDLSTHANAQRPAYALGNEGGLLLCTWPRGKRPTLPFVYSDEVWTGIEYQVASHLIIEGMVEEGLEIVRTTRDRYDGRVRNPFNEYECGHWYARAMASYALLQAFDGK